jgi:hypothetical protein
MCRERRSESDESLMEMANPLPGAKHAAPVEFLKNNRAGHNPIMGYRLSQPERHGS